MSITITALERSPDGGMGLTRDTRVRWAFEEIGQPYEAKYNGVKYKVTVNLDVSAAIGE